MIHEIEVSNLMFNKTSDEKINFKKYDINVELEEESSNDQRTILKYSLDLTSNPKNSVINISGSTTLNGEQSEIEELLKQEDEKTPEVVSIIYQELFPLMYIISKNMKIPSPAHTISQNNVRESNEQDKKGEISDEKPLETQTNDNNDEPPVETQTNDNNEEVNETNQSMKESQETETKTDMKSDVEEKQNNEDES
jgi:hypothetical protein